MLVCNKETIFNSAMSWAEKCEKLAPVCAEEQENMDFFKPYFCSIDGNSYITIFLILLLLIILFKFICTTIEEFVAPAIVYLCEYLNLSESLAGVTLLAFANGAGDVLTAIVASDSKEGISYNIGALYGAGLFVITFVVAVAILQSEKEIIISQNLIYRDLGFYILATLTTLGFALYGKLSWWSSCIMLGLYLLLVIIVIVQERMGKEAREVPEEDSQEQIINIQPNQSQDEEQSPPDTLKGLWQEKLKIIRKKFLNLTQYSKKKTEIRESSGVLVKIIEVIDYPFNWLRKLTIPPCEEEHYNHKYTILWPLLGIPFIVWNFFGLNYYAFLIAIPFIVILIVLFYKTKQDDSHKLPNYYIFIILIGTLSGILWTKFACETLVDMLSFVGKLTGLSSTYLGLTVIAVGNALPDGLTTIAIAKQGQALMGLTGGIVGQLFGLLVGFGVSMLKKTLNEGDQVFDLFNKDKLDENLLDLVVVFFAIVALCTLVFYGISKNRKFDKTLAFILLTIYSLFLLSTTIYAFKEAFFQLSQKQNFNFLYQKIFMQLKYIYKLYYYQLTINDIILILSSDSLLIEYFTKAQFKVFKSLQFSIKIYDNFLSSITSHIPSLASMIILFYKFQICLN